MAKGSDYPDKDKESDFDADDYEPRFHGYHDLMRFKIREILLVASLYDAFVLEEDRGLSEQIFGEYQDLGLSSPPRVIRVSSGKEALDEIKKRNYDLVITMTHLFDMDPFEFGKEVKAIRADLPVVLLVTDPSDLPHYHKPGSHDGIDKVFFWNGDSALFLAIIKYFEDVKNVDEDTKKGMVRVILIIEDSPRYYSMFLPLIYKEVMRQTQALVEQGLNDHEKRLRRRARPKILLAETYEEAMEMYKKYRPYILGIITDVSYPKDGKRDEEAGFKFVSDVDKDIPVLIQSSHAEHRIRAEEMNLSFLDKNSETLLRDLSRFMKEKLVFGDFVFRLPDGTEVGRASNMPEFIQMVKNVPAKSLIYHAQANQFSAWLLARGEFELAMELRPKKISDFKDAEEMRQYLIKDFWEANRKKHLGVITDFSQHTFEFEETITRFGGGSLGGKGRGIAFLSVLLFKSGLRDKFSEYKIRIPHTLIIGTEEFDKFISENNIHELTKSNLSDDEIAKKFVSASLSKELTDALKRYLRYVKTPIAVRSSSLLEDSYNQPFAGIYSTYILPNNGDDHERFEHLSTAIKLVYASAYFKRARAYIQTTLRTAEEDKMGVVLQKLVGNNYDGVFYPVFSGVAQTYNFYPQPPLKREDGIASVALGLGNIVVEGGKVMTFSPNRPNIIPGFNTPQDILRNSQRKFYALNMKDEFNLLQGEDATLVKLEVREAERHGTLHLLASTYDPKDNIIRDGYDHEGVKLITFAPILKYDKYPLAKILKELLKIGQKGIGGAIEMEMAARLDENHMPELFLLQIRPLLALRERGRVVIEEEDRSKCIVYSTKALGNGIIDNICDIIFVPRSTFDRAKTIDVAREIGEVNKMMDGKPYILIGPGRWGSADRWLGIPTTWDQISNARTIVETPIEDIKVEPSQGSHFFHNIACLGIPYLTITYSEKSDFVDWEWLEKQECKTRKNYVCHVRLTHPVVVKVDGRSGHGVILKISDRHRDGA